MTEINSVLAGMTRARFSDEVTFELKFTWKKGKLPENMGTIILSRWLCFCKDFDTEIRLVCSGN